LIADTNIQPILKTANFFQNIFHLFLK